MVFFVFMRSSTAQWRQTRANQSCGSDAGVFLVKTRPANWRDQTLIGNHCFCGSPSTLHHSLSRHVKALCFLPALGSRRVARDSPPKRAAVNARDISADDIVVQTWGASRVEGNKGHLEISFNLYHLCGELACCCVISRIYHWRLVYFSLPNFVWSKTKDHAAVGLLDVIWCLLLSIRLLLDDSTPWRPSGVMVDRQASSPLNNGSMRCLLSPGGGQLPPWLRQCWCNAIL